MVLAVASAPILAALISVATGRKLKQLLTPTTSAICYGMTPGSVFGWIPNPFFLFGIMALVYQGLAFFAMLELSKRDTILLLITWLIVFGLLQDVASYMFMHLVQG